MNELHFHQPSHVTDNAIKIKFCHENPYCNVWVCPRALQNVGKNYTSQ